MEFRKLAVLLHDSRSGSTFLSQQLDAQSEISVSIETKVLHNLLDAPSDCFQDLNRLLEFLADQDFRINNLVQDREYLEKLFNEIDRTDRWAVAQVLLASHFGSENSADVWCVKCSMSLPHLDRLAREYPDLLFLHIIRDGRGVLNSKMKTKRVYRTGYMAEEVVSPAKRWRQYLDAVTSLRTQYPSRVHELSYEALLRELDVQMLSTRTFFNLPEMVPSVSALEDTDYHDRIPERERSLHVNVSKTPQAAFVDKWREALPQDIIMAYEWLNADILEEKGYVLTYEQKMLARSCSMWKTCGIHWIKYAIFRVKMKIVRMVNGSKRP